MPICISLTTKQHQLFPFVFFRLLGCDTARRRRRGFTRLAKTATPKNKRSHRRRVRRDRPCQRVVTRCKKCAARSERADTVPLSPITLVLITRIILHDLALLTYITPLTPHTPPPILCIISSASYIIFFLHQHEERRHGTWKRTRKKKNP